MTFRFQGLFGGFLATSCLLLASRSALPAVPRALPHVLVIGTGGTIAGVSVPGDPQHYDPGQLSVEAILKTIPELSASFQVDGQQLRDPQIATTDNPMGYVNVQSAYILEREWIYLAQQVNQALAGDYDAVIVTHGTDSLEETAFFLQLTVSIHKPVFVVGAMRPSSGLAEPDGPDNLRTAFRLILESSSADMGVMVVSQFHARSAYDIMKVDTFTPNLSDSSGNLLPSEELPDAFDSPNFGLLASVTKVPGSFTDWPVTWNMNNALIGSTALATQFALPDGVTALPEVPIIYEQMGNDAVDLLQSFYFAQKPGIKGYVFVGSGNCSPTQDIGTLLASLAEEQDLLFVRSSHVATIWCQFTQDDNSPNTTGSGTLSPQHAKILMQLFQVALESGADLGDLVNQQMGFRDKARAFFSEHVIYPYHVGSFEPIHDSPPPPK